MKQQNYLRVVDPCKGSGPSKINKQVEQLLEQLSEFITNGEGEQRQINNLKKSVIVIKKHIEQMQIDKLKESFNEYMYIESLGLQKETARLIRYIPLRIYLLDYWESDKIYNSIFNLLNRLGFEITSENKSVFNAFYKKFVAGTIEAATMEELKERLEMGKTAIEMSLIGNSHLIESDLALPATAFIKSVKDISAGIIQIGTLLIVKNSCKVSIKSLSKEELQHIENHPEVTREPETVLKSLS